jgi:hypothetical protein
MRMEVIFRRLSFTILAVMVSLHSLGASARPVPSAHREPTESYQEAASRARKLTPQISLGGGDTAQDIQAPLASLNLKDIPEAPSMADLQREFTYVRDTHFINESSLQFPRRVSWLYPDDGCYVRAELTAQYIKDHGFVSPKKLYAFGNLRVSTKNSPTGAVTWWYHVAAVYRVGDVAYVFDPAVNPAKPLSLNEWNAAIGGTRTDVGYTLCSTYSIDPQSTCDETNATGRATIIGAQMEFLEDEWARLEELNRDPVKELGDQPPW